MRIKTNWFITSFLLVMMSSCHSATVPTVSDSEHTVAGTSIICIPAQADKELTEAVNDMAYWLGRSSGSKYEIVKNCDHRNPGIHILHVNTSALNNELKKQVSRDGQSFHLQADANTVRITGTGRNSWINGIYTWLHEIGFRWFMPGETWTIVPSSIKNDLRINKVYTPDFRDRFYAWSGGINAIPVIDPQNQNRKDYILWNQRNRFSYDYISKGHSGHTFYNANKDVLDKNPGYFCNGVINKYGRIDITKPQVVELYIKWALDQKKKGDPFPVIGVDPSDGSGNTDDCLPKNMPGIKTWSDKYFWIANKVAERIPPSDDSTMVQMYAYSVYADVPNFELNKRIFPIIIPYAFQRVTTPEEYIRLWQKKLNNRPMGIYDYWNITQWSMGLPQFDIYSIPQKLRLWKENNIVHFNLEASSAKGAMGHSLWLLSQMMWNTNLSFDSLYNDFLVTCFGPAANDVKRMYDRWSRKYQQQLEVNLSLQDLATASSKTQDRKILNRLTELKAYVHFMKMYYAYESNPTAATYDNLVNYVYDIHPLRLIQTSALVDYYLKKPANYTTSKQARPKPDTSLQRLYARIDREFTSDLQQHKFSYSVSDFTFDIRKAKAIPGEKGATTLYITGLNSYNFYIPNKQKIVFKAGASSATKFRILDEQNNIIIEKPVTGSKSDFQDIEVTLEKGVYNLLYGENSIFSRLQFPPGIVFVNSGVRYHDNAGYPLQYIYVPSDVPEIIYKDLNGPGTNKRGNWIDPSGKQVVPQKVGDKVYRIAVPPADRGKVWALDIGHRSYETLNIPNIFSLSRFTYQPE